MYRCSECGHEFEVKPDYCDCGNNIFVEIQNEIAIEKKKVKKQKVKKSFSEQYPWFDDFKNSLDPLSVIIFFLCCILSISLIVFVKPAKKEIVTETQLKKVSKSNIVVADIDTFWDDAVPKIVEQREIVIPQQKVAEVKEIKKTYHTAIKPKQTTKTITNNQPTKKTVQQKATQSQKTQNINNKSITSNSPVKVKSTQNITDNKTANNQSNLQQKTQISTQNIKLITNSIQEMKTYKNGLRNTITSKINFENIYGNGVCEVTFSVSSNGKLINRRFAKQSDDGTLNEEVYDAIMSTPKYQVPPTSYNGELLHYIVKMKNGSYSAALY